MANGTNGLPNTPHNMMDRMTGTIYVLTFFIRIEFYCFTKGVPTKLLETGCK